MVMGKKQYLFSGIPYAKPPTGSRRFVDHYSLFILNWFPFTPDFGNQRRFPHGMVFWMGPKCQTLVFRLYPWFLCISINLENSKIPCPVQCPVPATTRPGKMQKILSFKWSKMSVMAIVWIFPGVKSQDKAKIYISFFCLAPIPDVMRRCKETLKMFCSVVTMSPILTFSILLFSWSEVHNIFIPQKLYCKF